MAYKKFTGRIREKDSKSPIAFATIQIKGKDSTILANTTSDLNGMFYFLMETGKYKLTIRAKGYEPFSRDIDIRGRDKKFEIELRPTLIAPPNFRLTRFLPFK